MFETFLAAAALSTTAVATDEAVDVTARALAECGIEADAATVTNARGLKGAQAILAKANPQRGQIRVLIGGDLSGEDMKDFEFFGYHGCFFETDLSGTTWHEPTLVSTSFVRAKLAGANLEGASLDTARFVGVDASGANFRRASLGGASWIGAYWLSKLEGASFRQADMTHFSFQCGITMDEACGGGTVDFAGAELTDADFSQYPIWGQNIFDGAKVDRTVFSARAVPYLRGLDLVGPIHIGSVWQDGERKAPRISLSPDEYARLKAAADAASIDAPSFDCTKAATKVETVMCGEYESGLRRLDRDMAAMFGQALTKGKATRAAQRRWLKERDKCEARDCIEAMYNRRMDQLGAAVGLQVVLAPDAELQFESDVLPVPDAFRADPLYQRLTPAIRWASMQSVTLTGREDGTIEARGEAVGGNAHTCSLFGDALVYDPANGWYSGQQDDGSLIPILRVWENRLFFRYSGNMGDTPDEAGDFISCGARAGFTEMRQLGR